MVADTAPGAKDQGSTTAEGSLDATALPSSKLGSTAHPARTPHRRPRGFPPELRILLADAAMVLCQLLLFLNHYRRLLDASHCAAPHAPTPGAVPAPAPGPLAAYPCAAPTAARLGFLAARAGATFRAALLLPRGELWVPLVSSAILAQLLAILLLPRRAYLAYCRRPLMVAYPFGPGMLVLLAHCALSTAICAVVTGGPAPESAPLFNVAWVLAHTYVCAALATAVSLQQNPLAAQALRAALARPARAARAAATGIIASIAAAAAAAAAGARLLLGPAGAGVAGDAGPAGRADGACGSSRQGIEAQLQQALRRLLQAGRFEKELCWSPSGGSASGVSGFPSSVASSEPASQAPSAPGSGSHTAARAAGMGGAAGTGVEEQAAAAAPAWPHEQPLPPVQPAELATGPTPAPGAGRAPAPPRHYAVAPQPPPRAVPAIPPAGNFSLKQPTGLSKLTIVEDQEFSAPAAQALSTSLQAIHALSTRSGRFRRYRSRAPPQRVYMKIPWAEPEQLPANFLERLNLALSGGADCMATGMSARAGCIELVFDVVPHGAYDSGRSFLMDRKHRAPRTNELAAALAGGGGGSGAPGGPDECQDGLEEAVLSGLLADSDPASWIDALHLQPPPGAEVLTQACGRVWISRWDPALRQWVPEKAGGIRPSELPRISHVEPPCIVVQRAGGGGAEGGAQLLLSVRNADKLPAFRARCRGRYLTVNTYPVRLAGGAASFGGGASRDDSAFELEGCRPAGAGGGGGGGAGSAAAVRLELCGGLPANGLLVIECKVGKLLSNWRPVLVTDDPLLAAEVSSALGRCSPATSSSGATATGGAGGADVDCEAPNGDDLLSDLGLWLDFVEVLGLGGGAASAAEPAGAVVAAAVAEAVVVEPEGGAGEGAGGEAQAGGVVRDEPRFLDLGRGLAALYATEHYRSHMAGLAVSLLEYAVDRGWTHTAGTLVRQLLAAGVPWPELLGRCSGGLTLLHRAVRSGAGEMVRLVVALGEQHGTPFDWQAVSSAIHDTGGGEEGGEGGDADADAGVTPLHLAAALPDGGRLAERILSEYEAACRLWGTARDAHGQRPVDCARASGHLHLADGAWLTGGATGRRAATSAAAAAALAAAATGHVSAVRGPADSGVSDAATSSLGRNLGFGCAGNSTSGGSCSSLGACSAAVLATAGSAQPATPAAAAAAAALSLSAACRVRPAALRAAAAAVAACAARLWCGWLRPLLSALVAPLVNDRTSEAAYVRAVGSRHLLWMCGYSLYQVSLVVAVAGRMIKEGRPHEMLGMLMFVAPHALSAGLLCANCRAWLAGREALAAAVTVTRTLAKLWPVLGLLPYPHSSRIYMACGLDVLLEGLVPAFFEQTRAPLALALRSLEGFVTGLLYHRLGVVPDPAVAVLYALSWALAAGLLTATLDVHHRRLLGVAQPVAAGAGGVAGRGGGGGTGAGTGARGGEEAGGPTGSWKKVD
ncbi:hypothetical protein GPECTOR_121g433 [Gonium pectorale]|uniref:Uncharacterized protein n=1 Tax=Gonium pectorale TaxID=33097 RepID=A0A150FYP2_GONPE|nr:hypothetical protein GPECTOR_121g433 [Gonium pectorale]|eukprot:KXZ42733.1 hypothetical protein GPECTOR_121g433 [Gonium pectorale]